jgi:MFS family permease
MGFAPAKAAGEMTDNPAIPSAVAPGPIRQPAETKSLPARSLTWQLGLSAYWFATSMKWFLLLNAILSAQVEQLVPGGEKGRAWGAVVMVGATWAMIGPALFGYLSDRTRSRFGKWRPYLAAGSGLTVVALMTLAGAREYWVIVAGYLLLQISDDVGTGPYSALIPALVPVEQRGRASGVMGLLMLTAQIVGGVLAFVLRGNIPAIYMAIAVVNVLCAAITLLVIRENPEPRRTPGSGFFQGWIEPWRTPDFRWVWFTRFLNALGFYLVLTYLRYFFVDVVRDFHFFGLDLAPIDPAAGDRQEAIRQAATRAVFEVALLISLVGAISSVLGGRLADRVGRKKVVYVAGALMSSVLPPFILVPQFTIIVFLAVIFGIGYGAYQSADWALVADVMPSKEDLAKDMGVWQASVATPQILSGAVGTLVDAGNAYRPGFGYTYTFLFAGLSSARSAARRSKRPANGCWGIGVLGCQDRRTSPNTLTP